MRESLHPKFIGAIFSLLLGFLFVSEKPLYCEDELPPVFSRGDFNNDLHINISDAVSLSEYLFNNGQLAHCLDAADINDDGSADPQDIFFLLNNLFWEGGMIPFPSYPHPRSWDVTPDSNTQCDAPDGFKNYIERFYPDYQELYERYSQNHEAMDSVEPLLTPEGDVAFETYDLINENINPIVLGVMLISAFSQQQMDAIKDFSIRLHDYLDEIRELEVFGESELFVSISDAVGPQAETAEQNQIQLEKWESVLLIFRDMASENFGSRSLLQAAGIPENIAAKIEQAVSNSTTANATGVHQSHQESTAELQEKLKNMENGMILVQPKEFPRCSEADCRSDNGWDLSITYFYPGMWRYQTASEIVLLQKWMAQNAASQQICCPKMIIALQIDGWKTVRNNAQTHSSLMSTFHSQIVESQKSNGLKKIWYHHVAWCSGGFTAIETIKRLSDLCSVDEEVRCGSTVLASHLDASLDLTTIATSFQTFGRAVADNTDSEALGALLQILARMGYATTGDLLGLLAAPFFELRYIWSLGAGDWSGWPGAPTCLCAFNAIINGDKDPWSSEPVELQLPREAWKYRRVDLNNVLHTEALDQAMSQFESLLAPKCECAVAPQQQPPPDPDVIPDSPQCTDPGC